MDKLFNITTDKVEEVIINQVLKENTIKNIKKTIEESDGLEIEDSELKTLKDKRKKSGFNKVQKGLLFIECFDKISECLSYLDKVDKESLEKYLESINTKNIRNLIEIYDTGSGAYFTSEKIKDEVEFNSIKINEVINLFFEIFSGDE